MSTDIRTRLVAALRSLIPLAQAEAAHLADTDCMEDAEAAWAVIDDASQLINNLNQGDTP